MAVRPLRTALAVLLLATLALAAGGILPAAFPVAEAQTVVDYDTDDNRLIEVGSRAQLDAIRWDLNGDGDPSSGNATTYGDAFPNRDSTGTDRMGCPNTCQGYELTADLDLAGTNWTPIGPEYTAIFDGNGHTISNMTVNEAVYQGPPTGLFRVLGGPSEVRYLGLINPEVDSRGEYIGTIAGRLWGDIIASYSLGGSAGDAADAGGLVGLMSGGNILASYSTTAAESNTGGSGGLVGNQTGGTITASYSTGAVTGAGSSGRGGLVGQVTGGSAVNSYWDTDTSGITATSTRGTGQTTSALQSPTTATGIYANWDDLTIDDVGTSNDDPWDFGTNSEYPVLNFGGHSLTRQGRVSPPSIALTQSGAAITTLAVTEGGSDVTYDVALGAAPTATVTVTVTSGDSTAAPVRAGSSGSFGGTATLTFSTTNWATTQTITVRAPDDADGVSESVTLSHTAANGGYDSVTASLAVTVTDDDNVEIDYDTDNDNLIEVKTLAQLDAIRHDTDGQGDQDTVSNTDWANHTAAFPNPATRMGCAGTCQGYELAAHLDFDTNGDGSVNSSDDYPNWDPLPQYSATFDGNGYTIANLNSSISAHGGWAGLFSGLSTSSGVIRSVGIINPTVSSSGGRSYAGALVGNMETAAQLYAAYVRGGSVTTSGQDSIVGGLVGRVHGSNTRIRASYAQSTSVSATGDLTHAGGLAGGVYAGGNITASWAASSVNNQHTGASKSEGGLAGVVHTTTNAPPANTSSVTSSYWDTTASSVTVSGGGTGRTTSQLQTPTAYGTQSSDIYRDWNLNLDGSAGNDDPWDFGTSSQYPALKYKATGYSFIRQRYALTATTSTDYDGDNDNLIDIRTLAQLNAIRHDLAGAGAGGGDAVAYAAAFPDQLPGMGCPDGCTGYELDANLDFTGSDYASGPGWVPVGKPGAAWRGDFIGRGHTISNLTINSADVNDLGLFGEVDSATIEGVGLLDVNITSTYTSATGARLRVGALASRIGTTSVRYSYATGVISVDSNAASNRVFTWAGGLIGDMANKANVAASWSSVDVTVSSNSTHSTDRIGGLVGFISANSSANRARVTASYATGDVSGNRSARNLGGLIGIASHSTITACYATGQIDSGATRGGLIAVGWNNPSIVNSYWDSDTSGVTTGSNGAAQTTSALQSPTEYGTAGIYAAWNVDVDGQTGNDDPWDFGSNSQYPVLKFNYNANAIDRQRLTPIDYDADDDGLIEVGSLAQLDAIRHDRNGNGVVSAGDYASYKAAYPALVSCPGCRGYELTADLDFTGSSWASGAGWTPIGDASAAYTGDFAGRGYDIANLYINTTTAVHAGLFGHTDSSLITGVGLPDADITVTYANNTANAVTLHAGALIGQPIGDTVVRSSHSTGSISITASGSGTGAVGIRAGGLIGDLKGRTAVAASWSSVAVTAASSTGGGSEVGGLVGIASTYWGSILASYATGDVTATRTGSAGSCSAAGLLGFSWRGSTITGSYSTGTPSCTAPDTEREGGLHTGTATHFATITASYWDETATGISTGSYGTPQTTSALQMPTAYGGSGIYSTWNVDVDNADGDGTLTTGRDDPWNFVSASAYPILHYDRDAVGAERQLNPGGSATDYDGDDDNLIDVTTLAQLDAIRYDLDGDGVSGKSWHGVVYAKAFPGLTRGMGCPAGCEGYELQAHLDFDTDDSGSVDSGDDYPNWTPLGAASGSYDAKFAGNGYTIANLTISRSSTDAVGLFGVAGADAEITGVGLPDVDVTGDEYVGALVGTLRGEVSGSWSLGSVTGAHTVGGLVGRVGASGADSGTANISASYSRAEVEATGSPGVTQTAGGLAGRNYAVTTTSYAAGQVTTDANTPGGLVGYTDSSGSIASSYWDNNVGPSSSSGGGTGLTTANMQSPTAYGATSSDTYNGWNTDVDGQGGVDDPWDFGHSGEYPALKYGVGRSLIKQGRNGIVLTRSGTAINALAVDEGAGAGVSYAVALADPPTAGVTVTVASGNTAVTIDDGSGTFGADRTLTFTTANWADAQTVTVKAGDDNNIADETVALTHTGDNAATTDSGYDDAERTLNLTVKDSDTPGIVLTQSGSSAAITALSVTEEGSNVDYGVALSHEPTGTVTVTVAATGVSVDGPDGDSTFSASETMTFDATNWSTAKTVTVQAPGNDVNTDNETATLAHSGGGGGYAGVTKSLSVTIVDNDQPNIVLTPATTLTVTEEGSNTYTVALATLPTADVTVTVTASAGLTIDGPDAGSVFSASETLSFTTATWNSAQTITVRAAADDDLANGSGTLSHAAADATPGTASGYSSISASLPVAITDNDTPTIVLSETGTLSVDEGDSDGATYTVKLSHRPAAGVTITVTSSTSDDVTIDGPDAGATFSDSEEMEFTVGNWDTAQTVTVKAADDADLADDTGLTLAHAAADTTAGMNSLFSSAATVNLSVTATDTTTPSIVLTQSGNAITTLSVTEESSDVTYDVALSHLPLAGVTVTVASGDSAVTIDGPDSGTVFSSSETVVFTTGDWNTTQPVTVRAPADGDSVNESVTLTHSAADTTASASGYGSVSKSLTVSVTDNDVPGLDVSATSLTLDEATTGSFTVKLTTQPTGTVTVGIASDNDDVGLRVGISGNYSSSVSLSFTTGNYGTDQTVNVQAGTDLDGDDDTAALSFTISGGDYGSVTHGDFTVNVTDDDDKGITFDPANLTGANAIGEGTDTGSYTVELDTEPTGTVTVSISSSNPEVTIRRGSSGSFGSSASLSFSATNWNSAQTVQVKAAEDNDSANDSATLTHTADGGGYGDPDNTGPLTAVSDTLSVSVTDNDTPGINLSRTALTITEQAARQTYTVRLNTQPSAAVTVAISKATTNAEVTISATDNAASYGDTASLSFTRANWDTPQTVYVKAGDDANGEGESNTLEHTASGGDYNSLTRDLALTITDNDTKAIVLTPASLSGVNEGTSTTTYTVRLATQPTGSVTVAVSSDNAAVRVRVGAGSFGSTASLTFSATTWNSAQTVTVEAPEDDNSVSENVTISHVGNGGGYGDGNGPNADISQDLSVSVTDDDTPSLRVSASSVSLNEATAGNGNQGSFNVRLNTEPTAAVTVRVRSDNSDVQIRTGSGSYGSSVSLTFNATGGSLWDTDQAVNVRAGQDLDGDNDAASLSFTISGGDYNSVTQTAVSVTVTDDDPKGITLSETGNLAVSEGAAAASYTVVLDTRPSATVRVTVTSSDAAKVSVSRRSGGGFGSRLTLSFNTSNYGAAQTVYARGNADDDTVSETGISLAHSASGGGYAGITASLSVALTDTSTPGLVLSPAPLDIKESTEQDYAVRLTTQPASAVTVTIRRNAGSAGIGFDADGDGAFATTGSESLTFNSGNWNAPQTVKVRAPADVAADTTATLSHTAGGADYGSVSASLTVNVRDNRPPVAEAGAAQQAYSGQTITLEGSATDPDDAPATLSYAWRQSGGTPEVTLAGADTARPSFTVPTTLTADTEVQFELTVTDPSGRTDTDTVQATLLAARPNELVSLRVIIGNGDASRSRTLTPSFASIRRSFDTYVDPYTATAQIALAPADKLATVSVNGDPPVPGRRTVTVDLAEGHNRFTIRVAPSPTQSDLEPVTYRLNIRRQAAPRLAFAPAQLALTEGETATYTVNLDTRWLGAEVTVAIRSDHPAVTVSPASVSYTPSDWAPRTITVTAADDADATDDFATLTHSARGGHFDNVVGRVSVAVADDDGDAAPEPTPGQTPEPTPTPTPAPTPPPGLPTLAVTYTTELPVGGGRTVTITRRAGSLSGVTLTLPSRLARSPHITFAPAGDDIPRVSSRFGLGADPAAQSLVSVTVTNAPAGGLTICLPIATELLSEAANRPLTLARYDAIAGGGWVAVPGAERREMQVCAAGLTAFGTFAVAYAIPPLGAPSALTVAVGNTAGTLTLRWTPGAHAQRHWIAGIKQTDWDAGNFRNLIWTAADSSAMHTLSGLDGGAEYVFAVAAGRRMPAGGTEWSDWSPLARGTPR